MFLPTKLGETLIPNGIITDFAPTLVRRIIGRTKEEETRHFSGKMKKEAVFFWRYKKLFVSLQTKV